jgi:hypothetical protein
MTMTLQQMTPSQLVNEANIRGVTVKEMIDEDYKKLMSSDRIHDQERVDNSIRAYNNAIKVDNKAYDRRWFKG